MCFQSKAAHCFVRKKIPGTVWTYGFYVFCINGCYSFTNKVLMHSTKMSIATFKSISES
jgi:hypothetical protein